MTQSNRNPVSLSEISSGKTVLLVMVDAGRELKNRLAEMGILPNTEIHVIQNDHNGQIIVSVKNSKMILGKGMSQKMMVI